MATTQHTIYRFTCDGCGLTIDIDPPSPPERSEGWRLHDALADLKHLHGWATSQPWPDVHRHSCDKCRRRVDPLRQALTETCPESD